MILLATGFIDENQPLRIKPWLSFAALGDRPVLLLRGHGNVVVGPSVQHAVTNAIWTEVNARLQLSAMQLGGTVNFITPEEGAAWDKNPGDVNRGWQAWRKTAMEK